MAWSVTYVSASTMEGGVVMVGWYYASIDARQKKSVGQHPAAVIAPKIQSAQGKRHVV